MGGSSGEEATALGKQVWRLAEVPTQESLLSAPPRSQALSGVLGRAHQISPPPLLRLLAAALGWVTKEMVSDGPFTKTNSLRGSRTAKRDQGQRAPAAGGGVREGEAWAVMCVAKVGRLWQAEKSSPLSTCDRWKGALRSVPLSGNLPLDGSSTLTHPAVH